MLKISRLLPHGLLTALLLIATAALPALADDDEDALLGFDALPDADRSVRTAAANDRVHNVMVKTVIYS